jgi:hypothetical protein
MRDDSCLATGAPHDDGRCSARISSHHGLPPDLCF